VRASGDLGLPSGHGEKWLLRMLFVLQSTLALWSLPEVIIQAKTGRTFEYYGVNFLDEKSA
jgi:hypothetical protein